jgi:hypothetical protein
LSQRERKMEIVKFVEDYYKNPKKYAGSESSMTMALKQLGIEHNVDTGFSSQPEIKDRDIFQSLGQWLAQPAIGFLEGFSTFNTNIATPENDFQGILRSIGHLGGFVTGVPRLAVSKLEGVLANATKGTIQEALGKWLAGSTRRALAANIVKSGVELGMMSSIASWQHGANAMMDSFISGGVFGAGNVFLNAIPSAPIRIIANAIFAGLPSTMRGDSTPQQVYEYLLGAYFGRHFIDYKTPFVLRNGEKFIDPVSEYFKSDGYAKELKQEEAEFLLQFVNGIRQKEGKAPITRRDLDVMLLNNTPLQENAEFVRSKQEELAKTLTSETPVESPQTAPDETSPRKPTIEVHTGSAEGADLFFEQAAVERGMPVKAYSFEGHKAKGDPNNIVKIEQSKLDEAFGVMAEVAKSIGKTAPSNRYVRNLIARNKYQVDNADMVVAIAPILKPGETGQRNFKNNNDFDIVDGGTGYAVHYAIKENKPVFVYDTKDNTWKTWQDGKFVPTDKPVLAGRVAGIGSRSIKNNPEYKKVIEDLFDSSIPKKPIDEGSVKVSESAQKPEPIIISNRKGGENPLHLRTGNLKKNGLVGKDYRVEYGGKVYVDAHTAYTKNKTGDERKDAILLRDILKAKLEQHPELIELIDENGGINYIDKVEYRSTFKGDNIPSTVFRKALKDAYSLIKLPSTSGNPLAAIRAFAIDPMTLRGVDRADEIHMLQNKKSPHVGFTHPIDLAKDMNVELSKLFEMAEKALDPAERYDFEVFASNFVKEAVRNGLESSLFNAIVKEINGKRVLERSKLRVIHNWVANKVDTLNGDKYGRKVDADNPPDALNLHFDVSKGLIVPTEYDGTKRRNMTDKNSFVSKMGGLKEGGFVVVDRIIDVNGVSRNLDDYGVSPEDYNAMIQTIRDEGFEVFGGSGSKGQIYVFKPTLSRNATEKEIDKAVKDRNLEEFVKDGVDKRDLVNFYDAFVRVFDRDVFRQLMSMKDPNKALTELTKRWQIPTAKGDNTPVDVARRFNKEVFGEEKETVKTLIVSDTLEDTHPIYKALQETMGEEFEKMLDGAEFLHPRYFELKHEGLVFDPDSDFHKSFIHQKTNDHVVSVKSGTFKAEGALVELMEKYGVGRIVMDSAVKVASTPIKAKVVHLEEAEGVYKLFKETEAGRVELDPNDTEYFVEIHPQNEYNMFSASYDHAGGHGTTKLLKQMLSFIEMDTPAAQTLRNGVIRRNVEVYQKALDDIARDPEAFESLLKEMLKTDKFDSLDEAEKQLVYDAEADTFRQHLQEGYNFVEALYRRGMFDKAMTILTKRLIRQGVLSPEVPGGVLRIRPFMPHHREYLFDKSKGMVSEDGVIIPASMLSVEIAPGVTLGHAIMVARARGETRIDINALFARAPVASVNIVKPAYIEGVMPDGYTGIIHPAAVKKIKGDHDADEIHFYANVPREVFEYFQERQNYQKPASYVDDAERDSGYVFTSLVNPLDRASKARSNMVGLRAVGEIANLVQTYMRTVNYEKKYGKPYEEKITIKVTEEIAEVLELKKDRNGKLPKTVEVTMTRSADDVANREYLDSWLNTAVDSAKLGGLPERNVYMGKLLSKLFTFKVNGKEVDARVIFGRRERSLAEVLFQRSKLNEAFKTYRALTDYLYDANGKPVSYRLDSATEYAVRTRNGIEFEKLPSFAEALKKARDGKHEPLTLFEAILDEINPKELSYLNYVDENIVNETLGKYRMKILSGGDKTEIAIDLIEKMYAVGVTKRHFEAQSKTGDFLKDMHELVNNNKKLTDEDVQLILSKQAKRLYLNKRESRSERELTDIEKRAIAEGRSLTKEEQAELRERYKALLADVVEVGRIFRDWKRKKLDSDEAANAIRDIYNRQRDRKLFSAIADMMPGQPIFSFGLDPRDIAYHKSRLLLDGARTVNPDVDRLAVDETPYATEWKAQRDILASLDVKPEMVDGVVRAVTAKDRKNLLLFHALRYAQDFPGIENVSKKELDNMHQEVQQLVRMLEKHPVIAADLVGFVRHITGKEITKLNYYDIRGLNNFFKDLTGKDLIDRIFGIAKGIRPIDWFMFPDYEARRLAKILPLMVERTIAGKTHIVHTSHMGELIRLNIEREDAANELVSAWRRRWEEAFAPYDNLFSKNKQDYYKLWEMAISKLEAQRGGKYEKVWKEQYEKEYESWNNEKVDVLDVGGSIISQLKQAKEGGTRTVHITKKDLVDLLEGTIREITKEAHEALIEPLNELLPEDKRIGFQEHYFPHVWRSEKEYERAFDDFYQEARKEMLDSGASKDELDKFDKDMESLKKKAISKFNDPSEAIYYDITKEPEFTKYRSFGNLKRRSLNLLGYEKTDMAMKRYILKLIDAKTGTEFAYKAEDVLKDFASRINGDQDLVGWERFMRLYVRDSLNFPTVADTFFKGSIYNALADHTVYDKVTKFFNSPLMVKLGLDKYAPKSPMDIIKWSNMEAKYELASLLFSTKTYINNIFGASLNDMIFSGVGRYMEANKMRRGDVNLFNLLPESYKSRLTVESNTNAGRSKIIDEFVSENGVILSFLEHEVMMGRLRFSGKLKGFFEEVARLGNEKGLQNVKWEELRDIARKLDINDSLWHNAAYFMRESEKIARKNSFLVGYMHFMRQTGNHDVAIELAKRQVEATQYLYTNAHRPAFARSGLGKVLTRFQLWTMNSLKFRSQIIREARYRGYQPGTEEFNRLKRMMAIDLFMLAMANAFAFSIFESSLPPPYSYIQDTAQLLFGDAEDRDKAFFGTYGLNIVLPPISRIPMQTFKALLTDDWDRFTSYHIWTMFPFGRFARDVKRTIETPEMVAENLTGIPLHKLGKTIRKDPKNGFYFNYFGDMNENNSNQ